MLHHKCQVLHKPAEGKHGDCLRACIASILNVPEPLDVPHFAEDGRQDLVDDRLRDYLRTHGLNLMFHAHGGLTSLDDILEVTGKVNPGIPFLLFCSSGPDDHCIIIKDGAVTHDPSLWRATPYGPLHQNGYWVLGCLTPILE